jgi:hypothetical protein
VVIDLKPVTLGLGQHDNGADANRSRKDGLLVNAVFLGVFVSEFIDFTIRDAYGGTLGGLHLDRLMVVAKRQDGLDLPSFGVGHLDATEGRFLGEERHRAEKDDQKNRNSCFHVPESISKGELAA